VQDRTQRMGISRKIAAVREGEGTTITISITRRVGFGTGKSL
jgi:hypothetical protein